MLTLDNEAHQGKDALQLQTWFERLSKAKRDVSPGTPKWSNKHSDGNCLPGQGLAWTRPITWEPQESNPQSRVQSLEENLGLKWRAHGLPAKRTKTTRGRVDCPTPRKLECIQGLLPKVVPLRSRTLKLMTLWEGELDSSRNRSAKQKYYVGPITLKSWGTNVRS